MGLGEYRGNFSLGELMFRFVQVWDRRMNLVI